MIEIGSVVNGKYQLIRLVGDGGMGSVYEALHTVLGTRVAIKVLHPELAKRTGLVERFLQEARVAAQIRSPHVVQVTDVDRTPDGYAYIVMELLEGEPLSSVLDRERRLPVATACEYTLQILEALEAAHALQVIHRDLKPENVFVTFAAGRPVLKLIDFGIAKARRTDPTQRNLTVAGVVMGTAEYMAPEQARSADKVDQRSDLYAVGVMLYEMLSGVRPVLGDDARVIALKVERGEIAPLVQSAPDVPRELAGLVHRAMAARPELRFATATEMRLALEKASSGRRPGTAPLPIPAPASEALGTGTLKNLPANQAHGGGTVRPGTGPGAAAGQSTPGPATDFDKSPVTERAPPIATALTGQVPVYSPPGPGQVQPGGAPAYAPPPRPARRGGGGAGRMAALIALPILLGIGAVLVLMATGAWSFGSSTPPPPTTDPSLGQVDAAPSVDLSSPGPTVPALPTVATVTPPGTIPNLAPTGRIPGGPRPPSSAHPQHSGQPAVEDAGAPPPPFLFPTTLPGIPSVLPPFPTEFPTAFPWPGGPAPAPPPAPGHSSGSI